MNDEELLKLAQKTFGGPSGYRVIDIADESVLIHPDLMNDLVAIAREVRHRFGDDPLGNTYRAMGMNVEQRKGIPDVEHRQDS